MVVGKKKTGGCVVIRRRWWWDGRASAGMGYRLLAVQVSDEASAQAVREAYVVCTTSHETEAVMTSGPLMLGMGAPRPDVRSAQGEGEEGSHKQRPRGLLLW